MAESDPSLTQMLSIAAAAVAVVGGVYNFSYFAVADLDFMMLLDYTDFLYTPIYLLVPSGAAALMVLSIRSSMWRGRSNAAALDRTASMVVIGLSLGINIGFRNEVGEQIAPYIDLFGMWLIILSLGICLLWICDGMIRLPEMGTAVVVAWFGFAVSAGLYGAHVARADLKPTSFGDKLIVKDGKVIDAVHIARITGKGVFFVARDVPGVLSFQRSDAYEGIEHKAN